MRSGGEKWAIGEIKLTSSWSWIILTSGLSTCWRTCKLPHCAIDSDVAFWYHYFSPAWMHGERDSVLSLSDAWWETSLGVGLLKKIVADKKGFIGRSYENCHFQCRNSAVHLLLRRWRHSNSIWNWFHMFSYKRLFFFLLLTRHTIHPQLLSSIYAKFTITVFDYT